MDAQLQQDIIEAAQEFWIEWNYDAEHLYSYLNSDTWLDDEDDDDEGVEEFGMENNNNYKSIIDEKVEAAMTHGAICDEEHPLHDEVVAKAEKQYDEIRSEQCEREFSIVKSAISLLLGNNLISKKRLIEIVNEMM